AEAGVEGLLRVPPAQLGLRGRRAPAARGRGRLRLLVDKAVVALLDGQRGGERLGTGSLLRPGFRLGVDALRRWLWVAVGEVGVDGHRQSDLPAELVGEGLGDVHAEALLDEVLR